MEIIPYHVEEIFDKDMNPVTVANHAEEELNIKLDIEVPICSMIRKAYLGGLDERRNQE